MMLNMSNLAWFEDSVALPQHLQTSRMRALETQHPMLRATNTGATAIVDASGKVVARLPYNTSGVLDGTVQGHRGTTPVYPLRRCTGARDQCHCSAVCGRCHALGSPPRCSVESLLLRAIFRAEIST